MSKIDFKTMPAITLRDGASVISDLEKKHAAAERDLAGASAAMKEATTKYQAALGEGREAAIAARRVCTDAEVDVDIASRAVDTLARMVVEASEAFRFVGIEHKRAEAERLRGVFEGVAHHHLAAMASASRDVIRAWAEAQVAIEDARSAQGQGGPEIPDAEDFRQVPREERREVRREKVVLWLRDGLNPYPDEIGSKIVPFEGGGFLKNSAMAGGGRAVAGRAQFVRVTYTKARPAMWVPALVESLSVPAVVGGQAPGWVPEERLSPSEVLARLSDLERAPALKAPEFETVDVFEHRVS